jgi:hypothetical protein
MTWTQVEASKARRLLTSEALLPEKRAALQAKLEEFTLNPQAQAPLENTDAIAKGRTELEPFREAQLPSKAADFETATVQRTPEEEIEHARMLEQTHVATYNDQAANASKLRELDVPPEYSPPTADIAARLTPLTWQEPSVEQFQADMGQLPPGSVDIMSPKDLADPENSHAYKVYRDKKWKAALEQAQAAGQPIVRSSMMPGLWKSIQEKSPEHIGSNVISGVKSADAFVRGAGDMVSLGAAGAIDRAIRPEEAAEAEENARVHDVSNTLGTVAGAVSPVGLGPAIFGGVKAGLGKALPAGLKGGLTEATAAGALSASAMGAVERGFSENGKVFDPDRALIETLLGGTLGAAGHVLGAAPAKGRDLIETGPRGPVLETAEQLGVRLGPLGGVNLPPAAKALQAERRAIPLAERPSSETQMVVDRIRPKIAEAGFNEAEGLKSTLERQTGAYNASAEGMARVPVERTLQAARDRIDALKDASGRPLPGSSGGMSLAEELEQQLAQFGDDGARTMNAAEMDRFLEWVDQQANVAKKAGAKDPLYEDFMRSVREDRQQFGANDVTGDATATLGGGEDVTGLAAMKAKQEIALGDQDKFLVQSGLPREFNGREPGFDGRPGPVRLDPKQDVPQLNRALQNAYTPGQGSVTLSDGRALSPRQAVEHFAQKAGVIDDLRAMGATQIGEELRNMGRLFGPTTQSGTRYGRVAHAALPWVRAMASDGRIPSNVLAFVRGLRRGYTGKKLPGPVPGMDDFGGSPLFPTPMSGLGMRGGALGAKARPGIEASEPSLLSRDDPNEADPTLTEEDVANLARLIESTREQETAP